MRVVSGRLCALTVNSDSVNISSKNYKHQKEDFKWALRYL